MNNVISFLKVLAETTYSKVVSKKLDIETIKTNEGYKHVKVRSYVGSVKNNDLLEKGNFSMNIFLDNPAGQKLFRENLKRPSFIISAINACNSEAIRIAQNKNRVWDKKSEASQLKHDSMQLVVVCLAGKYGNEAKEMTEKQFPKDKYPSLY